jgi:hypothetical protein
VVLARHFGGRSHAPSLFTIASFVGFGRKLWASLPAGFQNNLSVWLAGHGLCSIQTSLPATL